MNPVQVLGRSTWLLLAALAGGAFAVADASAQRVEEVTPEVPVDERGVPAPRPSSFNLYGQADIAFAGNRPRGTSRVRLSNAAVADYYGGPYGVQWLQLGTPVGNAQRLFQGSLAMVSPRSEWQKARQRLNAAGLPGGESLANVVGGGYSAVRDIRHFTLFQPERWLPADDQLGLVHSGARTTDDGGCTDHRLGQTQPGFAALATSDCPETWGTDQFAGATRSIPLANWIQFFEDVGPADFHWEWWRVPEEYYSSDLLGDYQTYGKTVDWGLERRVRLGSVMPGGSGAPGEQGWPLGISVYFDAFTFELPTVANTVFYQALVVNESERVWGLGLDYDSLYFGMMHGVVMAGQSAAEFFRPDVGGVFITGSGTTAGCHGARAPTGVTACQGFGGSQGAFAIMVLNSPLGDLRNKLFTRPGSPFFAPDHPNAGDTITFNIGRMCGFGAACWNSTWDFSARSAFGLVAGVADDMFDGRTPDEWGADGFRWWRTFRNHDFPERTPRWNQMVVPGWDWNRDGVPDTISVPSCLGPEFGGPDIPVPCSEIFSDTLPGHLVNTGNNIGGFIGFGPFPLAAGDTTRFTLALVSGPTQTALLSEVDQLLAFYDAGLLRPSAPTAPRVVSVNTAPGDRGRTPGARVQIFIDDAAEEFVDEFLLFQVEQMEGSQLDIDNPWLLDSLRTLAHNNLAEIRVYKSCNAGRTWTATTNCFGDPARDEFNDPIGLGWQPYAVFPVGADGSVPNVFTDAAVTAGQRYLYSFVAVSRGFEADVFDRDPETGDIIPARREFVPKLTNPLSASVSDANVVTVYVPASRQAGARPADVEFVDDDPRAPTAFHPVSVTLTAEDVPGGEFRMVFGDSVVVRAIDAPIHQAGQVVARAHRTEVDLYRTVMALPADATSPQRTVYFSQTLVADGPAGVTTSGGVRSQTATGHSGLDGDTTYVTTTTYGNVLTLVTLDQNNRPLLVSSTLTGVAATPGTFLGRPDYPGFILSVNAGQANAFVSTVWREPRPGEDDDQNLRAAGSPLINYRSASSSVTPFVGGEYRFDFQSPEFGPTRLFRVNVSNPSQTQQEFTQSLERRAGVNTVVSEEVVAAIRATGTAAGDADITADDLLSVQVPFTVRNQTSGQDVIVVMRRTAKRDSIALGSGVNTVWVQVPEDRWVPGEPVILLERVTRFREAQTEAGQTHVVLDGAGQPVVHDSLMVTFDAATLACESPVTCNPLVPRTAGASATGHLNVRPGEMYLRVRYQGRITPSTAYGFAVLPAIHGPSVTEITRDDLEEIRVLPNPYVVFSTFERTSAERRIMFMGLPPRGTIQIFTVAGKFVQRITYDEADLAGNGDLFWDMMTFENQEIASGLYIFVVEGELPATGARVQKTGKFVVIKGNT